MELGKTHASDPEALKMIFSSLLLICKIFYSLNFQVKLACTEIVCSLCMYVCVHFHEIAFYNSFLNLF